MVVDTTIYAIFGENSGKSVSTSDFEKVQLGSGGSVVKVTNKTSALDWDDAADGTTTGESGGFMFLTENDIPKNNSMLLAYSTMSNIYGDEQASTNNCGS